MIDVRNIDGHFYPTAHPGWGSFADELFHYTSRYCIAAEGFLRSASGRWGFCMSGYKASDLSAAQRDLMAALLACPPGPQVAMAVIDIVGAVLRGEGEVDAATAQRYRGRLDHLPKHETVEWHPHLEQRASPDIDPLDPFLSLAERLLMPVAVRDHHVEVSLLQLAEHLQSANSTLRSNLYNAIVRLHNAGYVLRNHPHLTNAEAQQLESDDD